jgi:hypothetical protein
VGEARWKTGEKRTGKGERAGKEMFKSSTVRFNNKGKYGRCKEEKGRNEMSVAAPDAG